MSRGFVHSVKVPRLYKAAAKVIQEVCEKRSSIKSVLYKQKHPNVSGLYSLCMTALRKSEQLNQILNKTCLLSNEPRLDPWLARVLITELLWGKKKLKTECKPAQIILSYEKKLQEESSIICAEVPEIPNNAVRKARYVRINTLLLPLDKGISYFKEQGWVLLPKCSSYTEHLDVVKTLAKPHFIQDYHVPELLVFPPGTNVQSDPKYGEGELLLQDKASCLAAKLLDPKPGSTVLDMCAAPGMKTSHLAALINNSGKIYAVEVDSKRYGSLCQLVQLSGASCVTTLHKDALSLDGNRLRNVEYILVDPSCSGSGMLDRISVHGKEKSDPQRLKQLQAFQVFLLRHALLSFINVKRVVYSTCSINQEENEQVIDEVLRDVKDAYTLVDIRNLYKENWLHYSSREYNCSDKCLYTKHEVDLCNGFFIAIFERNTDKLLPPYTPKSMIAPYNPGLRVYNRPYVKEVAPNRMWRKHGTKRSMNFTETSAQESSPKIPITLNDSSDSVAIIEDKSSESKVEEIKQDPPAKKKKIGRNIRKAVKAKTPLARKIGKRVVKLPKRVKKTNVSA